MTARRPSGGADVPPPAHVLARPDDTRALCGERDPLPVVSVEFVNLHIRGWGMQLCPQCALRLAIARARGHSAPEPPS